MLEGAPLFIATCDFIRLILLVTRHFIIEVIPQLKLPVDQSHDHRNKLLEGLRPALEVQGCDLATRSRQREKGICGASVKSRRQSLKFLISHLESEVRFSNASWYSELLFGALSSLWYRAPT